MMGKILWINLSNDTFEEQELPENLYREYFGGYGLSAKIFYEKMKPKTDPLSPEALLGFFPGLLTGSAASLTGRFMVTGKSPLTGTWGDANCGGYFGPEIKKCGYDGIILQGQASTPKYITIIDGKMTIEDASEVWGLDAVEAEEKLLEKYPQSRIASIGQAGENISLISGIITDKGRIAARSGLGAVMGSKKVKAIVLKGNQKMDVADNSLILEHAKEYNKSVKEAGAGAIFLWKTLGTPWQNDVNTKLGDTPIKNWGGNSDDHFPLEDVEPITGPEINKYKESEYGCFACPVRCGGIVKVPEADIKESHLPEYETCGAFGHMLLNNDLMSIFKLNDLCNRAGMDTISAGGTIAFAVECFENGIIGLEETEGLMLKWGNADAYIELLKNMINREGIGDILADGSRKASERIGKGSEKYAIHSLGQELAMHSPKYYDSMGTTYAFDPTPGRHTAAGLDMFLSGPLSKSNGYIEGFALPKRYKRKPEPRAEAFKMVVGLAQSLSSLGVCQFTLYFQKYPLMEFIKGVTGWDISVDELIKTGLRIQALRQAFTLREEIDLVDNEIPKRAVGINYKQEYERLCKKLSWNPSNGYPLKDTLKNLNLDFVIKDLY
ncbi:MAG: Tungsten-containing aldehyde ferredoxin oxidoreductase [Promethearchaeota archaeon]|nr:MAG: Tungsten-containing aldehyde ferredoxin oxidoreductase [Candidatus Lokiarchaeota archaeon]